MKKALLFAALLLFSLCLVSCRTVIPGSVEAQEKLEARGYTVERKLISGREAEDNGVSQIVVLNVSREDKLCLQLFYFCTEEDTAAFYEDNNPTMKRNFESVCKNRYSIYCGTIEAVRDYLE